MERKTDTTAIDVLNSQLGGIENELAQIQQDPDRADRVADLQKQSNAIRKAIAELTNIAEREATRSESGLSPVVN